MLQHRHCLWAALILLSLAMAVEDELCFENRKLVTLGIGNQTVQASTVNSDGARVVGSSGAMPAAIPA